MILQNGKRIDGCSDTVPVGTLQPYLGLIPPKGYLVCQGQLVSKTTYSKLYEICGDAFGASTETHFYLPDLRGKTLAGYDENDTAMNTIGKLLGQKTHTHTTGNHTLTVDEIPIHRHGRYITTNEPGGSIGTWDPNYQYLGTNNWYTAEQNTVGDAGGGQAHNHGNTGETTNYQPTITVNWIVKAVMFIPEYFIVENTLTSTSTSNALSAAQGKLLNDSINTLTHRIYTNTLTFDFNGNPYAEKQITLDEPASLFRSIRVYIYDNGYIDSIEMLPSWTANYRKPIILHGIQSYVQTSFIDINTINIFLEHREEISGSRYVTIVVEGHRA